MIETEMNSDGQTKNFTSMYQCQDYYSACDNYLQYDDTRGSYLYTGNFEQHKA